MPYQCVAGSVAGFVQQLAVNYVARGYYFYVTGSIPERKDPAKTDRKIMEQYGIDISKWSRARRRKEGKANIQYDAKKHGFHVALSNPCFELWLYLHHRDNRHFIDRHQCQRELGNVCKSYATNGKSGYDAKSLIAEIDKAIIRAKKLDVRPQDPWPKTQATRVYLLVEKLLAQLLSLQTNLNSSPPPVPPRNPQSL